MNKETVKIKKLKENAIIPTYGSEYAAGADLYACINEPITIDPHETVMVGTGLSIELPVGLFGGIVARSGLASKKGLAPANKFGVADCDYRGEYMVALHNHSDAFQIIEPNERIAQLLIMPYMQADFLESDTLSETARDAGGFGSTGTK